jgi:hypothetical protein
MHKSGIINAGFSIFEALFFSVQILKKEKYFYFIHCGKTSKNARMPMF